MIGGPVALETAGPASLAVGLLVMMFSALLRSEKRRPSASDGGPSLLTIALAAPGAGRRSTQRLAEVAVQDELLVVCSGSGAPAIVTELRRRLPRHDVVALDISSAAGVQGHHAVVLNDLLEIGSLPVVAVPARHATDVAAQLSDFLGADRVLRAAGRTELREVWRRTDRHLVEASSLGS
jgi:hypothetical protein